MAELYSITNGSVALTAATAKTVIEVATGSNIDNVWVGFDVSFDGATSTATPVKVEIVSYTATGTGTAYTPKNYGQNQSRAALATAKVNDTVEPSTPTVLMTWYVPPTSGFSYLWPLGRELAMNPSKFYGIRVTAPAAVNCAANLLFEE